MPDPQRALATHLDQLAGADRLALLVDLDGTLIRFAATVEEAVLDEAVAQQLRALADLGVQVVVVTGRPRDAVESLIARVPAAWWVAEHGAWRRSGLNWRGPTVPGDELDELTAHLDQLIARTSGSRLERKTLSVCVHWRQVAGAARAALVTNADLMIDEWLESHPEHERLAGADMVEVRPRAYHKGVAVAWTRERLAAPILAIGDDFTDEDMFAALDHGDLAVAVGRQSSAARAAVDDVDGVHRLLAWLLEARRGAATTAAPLRDLRAAQPRPLPCSFLVISNRTPATAADPRRREVGGLVAALEPALQQRDGIWLGWSGSDATTIDVTLDLEASPKRATFGFPPAWRKSFYAGLCNRALWPLLHGFAARARYEDGEWADYLDANAAYARLAAELVGRDATIWVHDYHLLLVGAALRHRGHKGPLGLFLHVPFPPREVFETLPWAAELLAGMLGFDVVGFHTRRYAENFVACVQDTLGADHAAGVVTHRGRRTVVEAIPIGIDAEPFGLDGSPPDPEIESLRASLGDRKLLLGVDRLDYSKGVPERLEAFERMLERHPRWRGQVAMVQVSVPSRADVPEYAELRGRVEHLVGRINGRFGEVDWVPVRYLYRSYSQPVLAQLYRAADVGVVTPLRDGMNLVAKEFVAAQDPRQPGALVLSRFAGAADALDAAILTNPYHRDGLADDLARALAMPVEERRSRHARMLAEVRRTSATGWATEFLDALARGHRARDRRSTA